MSKTVLAILLLVLYTTITKAQTEVKQLQFGIIGSYAMHSYKEDVILYSQNNLADQQFSPGAYISYRFNNQPSSFGLCLQSQLHSYRYDASWDYNLAADQGYVEVSRFVNIKNINISPGFIYDLRSKKNMDIGVNVFVGIDVMYFVDVEGESFINQVVYTDPLSSGTRTTLINESRIRERSLGSLIGVGVHYKFIDLFVNYHDSLQNYKNNRYEDYNIFVAGIKFDIGFFL